MKSLNNLIKKKKVGLIIFARLSSKRLPGKVLKKIYLPHSLGFFYTAISQFLGFHNYGDEYKVMGLAAYGNNKNNYDMSKIIKFDEKKLYIINKKYILFTWSL